MRRSFYPQSFRAVLRYSLLCLALPCVYFGGACAAFLYRLHAINASVSSLRLPPVATPDAATRLMVFAPHCDDETLGCAGRIQQTLAAGGAVQTVILTNGDGYPVAVERQMRSFRARPADYIQFAALRQQESVHALQALGVPQLDTLFLGYPDRGLMALWNDRWDPDDPYVSAYTRCSASPYPITYHPASRYCGHDVLEDIKSALRAFHPTVVTVTHPAEDHPDHQAASAFVTLAVRELQLDPKEAGWASRIHLEYYLLHRGDWPAPQGAHPELPLLPPAAMAYLDTDWKSLSLTPAQVQAKSRSIGLYPSQTLLMEGFLTAFVRSNELFGEIATGRLPAVADGVIRMRADADDWKTVPPALLDAQRDTVLRDLQGGGDIRSLFLCRDSRYLYLRLDTRQPISARFDYTIRLRTFGPQDATGARACTLRLRPWAEADAANPDLTTAVQGRILEARLPWSALEQAMGLGPKQLLSVSAETALSGVEIDKTGVRILALYGSSGQANGPQ